MSQYALAEDGQEINAESYKDKEWEHLKATYRIGSYVMPCCNAPAVLKTSIRGVKFFSHATDDCATAPETIWHRDAKKCIVDAITGLGLEAREEVSGKSSKGQKWRADVFFEYGNQNFVIELQHTPQTLSEFLRRQQRYAESGIKSYWIVRIDVFRRLAKATAQQHLTRFHAGKFPDEGIGTGAIPELPVAILHPDAENPVQFGLMKSAKIAAWIQALISGSYKYDRGSWSIRVP